MPGFWPWKRASHLEETRDGAIADIEVNRVAYQDMLRRAAATGGAQPGDATEVQASFAQLVEKAKQAKSEEELDQLAGEAEALGQLRAYFCPEKEIGIEAKAHIFTLLDWSVPTKNVETLRDATGAVNGDDIQAARGALHVIYEEYDAWDVYLDEYNRNTSFWATLFLGAICLLSITALFMMFGVSIRILALVLAAVAGAVASVIARLPGVSSADDWQVNLRAYRARIGTGIVGSLIGIGLLGSGLITIALPREWQSADRLLEACLSATQGAAQNAVKCTPSGGLFLLALTMLLGFSERFLTSLESRVVPGPSRSLGERVG